MGPLNTHSSQRAWFLLGSAWFRTRRESPQIADSNPSRLAKGAWFLLGSAWFRTACRCGERFSSGSLVCPLSSASPGTPCSRRPTPCAALNSYVATSFLFELEACSHIPLRARPSIFTLQRWTIGSCIRMARLKMAFADVRSSRQSFIGRLYVGGALLPPHCACSHSGVSLSPPSSYCVTLLSSRPS